MTYAESIQFLYGLRLFGAKFGRENTLKLAALVGNPQNQLPFIHVAASGFDWRADAGASRTDQRN